MKVAEDDGLPSHCCWGCASTVLAWHELVLASVEADRRLRTERTKKEEDEEEVVVAFDGADDDSCGR